MLLRILIPVVLSRCMAFSRPKGFPFPRAGKFFRSGADSFLTAHEALQDYRGEPAYAMVVQNYNSVLVYCRMAHPPKDQGTGLLAVGSCR